MKMLDLRGKNESQGARMMSNIGGLPYPQQASLGMPPHPSLLSSSAISGAMAPLPSHFTAPRFPHPFLGHSPLNLYSSEKPCSNPSELPSVSPPPPRERFSYTRCQLEMLSCIYARVKYPNATQKHLIRKRVGITRDQVKIWFQNRRRKDKLDKHKKGKPTSNKYTDDPGKTVHVSPVIMNSIIRELNKFQEHPETDRKRTRLKSEGKDDESDVQIDPNSSDGEDAEDSKPKASCSSSSCYNPVDITDNPSEPLPSESSSTCTEEGKKKSSTFVPPNTVAPPEENALDKKLAEAIKEAFQTTELLAEAESLKMQEDPTRKINNTPVQTLSGNDSAFRPFTAGSTSQAAPVPTAPVMNTYPSIFPISPDNLSMINAFRATSSWAIPGWNQRVYPDMSLFRPRFDP